MNELRKHKYERWFGAADVDGDGAALGIVLNCLVLWNTVYIDDALRQSRAQGYPVLDGDVARLSPFIRRQINVHGRYSFQRPQLGGGRRALRDPDADDADDED